MSFSTKKYLIFAFILFFSIPFTFGQNVGIENREPCGADVVHREMMKTSQTYGLEMDAFEKVLEDIRKKANSPNKSSLASRIDANGNVIYQIPLVFHIMHKGESIGIGTNISDDQIKKTVKALNEFFRRVPGSNGFGNGVDAQIEFALAVRDPNGNCTNGINRVNMTGYSNYMNYGVKGSNGISDATLKAISFWNSTQYYNVWIVSQIKVSSGTNGENGYSYPAAAHGLSYDGVVLLAEKAPAAETTLTHEFGHALNLYHIFEGDDPDGDAILACPVNANPNTDGDKCADTPPCIRSTGNCNASAPNACDGGSSDDLYKYNYMHDLPGACTYSRNQFTAGQRTRMITALSVTRSSFLAENGNMSLVPVAAPVVDFTSDQTMVCQVGNSVRFYDKSSCIPNTYLADSEWQNIQFAWTFTNGVTTYNSTQQNPVITFAQAGIYQVTLTITSPFGVQTLSKVEYLNVRNATNLANVNTTANSSNNSENRSINRVTFNAIFRETPIDYNEGYKDFRCTDNTVVKEGETYPLSIRTSSTSTGLERFKVYIDYNNDGLFTPSEMVVQGMATTEGLEIFQHNIVIPTYSVKNTILTMRVIGDSQDITATYGNFRNADIEDYGVTIVSNCATESIDFDSNKLVSCLNSNVLFYDRSCIPNANLFSSYTYNWTFTNGTTTYTSSEQHPTIAFAQAGTYAVSLVITTPSGVKTVTKQNYIRISAALGAVCTTITSTNAVNRRNVNRVVFNTIDKQTSTSINEGYQDFRCSDNTVVKEGQTYSLAITTNSSGSTLERFKVYIDYNNDAAFSVSELVFSGTATAFLTIQTFTNNIIIPTTAVKNTYLTMRVVGDGQTINSTCGTFGNADVEDYGVMIIDCTDPPTGNATQNLCFGNTIADLVVAGTTIIWYDAATGGNVLPTSTSLLNGVVYYASQTINGCESRSRLAVSALVTVCENNKVGIGTVAPNSTLEVYGSFSRTLTKITNSTLLTINHSILLCDSGSNCTLTLPSPVNCKGRDYIIKNINSGVVSVVTVNGDWIDLQPSVTLTNGQSVTVICDGANWKIVKYQN